MKRPPRGLAIDISSSVRRLMVSRARVREAAVAALEAERVRNAMLSITFVGRAAMSEMNHRYLRHRGADRCDLVRPWTDGANVVR